VVLKSWDQNGVGVAKVHCMGCVKDLGCCIGDHNKVAVSNLFNNFRKTLVLVMYESNCRTFGHNRVVGMPLTA
jgi:hypothetical protein